MFYEILILFVATLLPLFELRLTIPLGLIILGTNIWIVLIIAFIANIFAAILGYYVIDFFILILTKISFFKKIYDKKVLKIQNKIKPSVDRYGWLGLALFIGVPLPGSGVYTGALVAKMIGMDFKKFIFASILGIIIAGTVVTLISLLGKELLVGIGYNDANIALFRKIFRI